ncbi:hypothetical protein P154DRAFT_148485 [Amniculicola lignicola CBS 123094]|uniref:DUF7492 domain-containing protein n=1 Tax=Amniculicola lignicola CBS 123094 TaxID=1392246 RepID=A0A6A5WLZ1_9PLEO|nr:hypothetical protein P154DRAFT_148485 [Amniculicola lignicola CBS 123094]
MVRLTSLLVVALAAPSVLGHTWIEQMRALNEKGEYVGEYGYPRSFVSKNEPGYNGETSMNFMNPPLAQQPPFINSTNLLCHPSQRTYKQSDRWPRLQVKPGQYFALRYSENGHVSNPSQDDFGRPKNGGTVFIYGTTEPKEDEKLADVLRWTRDGQGGDKRGKLIGANDFDDGRCYENNPTDLVKQRKQATPNFAAGQASNGPGTYPLMCENDVQMPQDAPMDKPYTIYWVWQWPKSPEGEPNVYPKGKDQYYSTCADIDIVEAIASSLDPAFALQQQDVMSTALSDWKSRTAFMTDAIKGELGDVFKTEAPKNTQAPNAPAPSAPATRTAPAPSASAPASAPAAPSAAPSASKSIPPPGLAIPTLTQLPGQTTPVAPAPSTPPAEPAPGEDVEIVTTVVTITVTAAAEPAVPTLTKRSGHFTRHFRG